AGLPRAPDQRESGAGNGSATGFPPWETYETGEGYGWTGGYGVAPGASAAQGYHAGPADEAPADSAAGYYGGVGEGTAAGEATPGHEGRPEDEGPEHGGRPPRQATSPDSPAPGGLLPGRHAAPPAGWRRAVYRITGGLVRAPQSAAERRRQDLVLRARAPVAGGHHRVAVLSLKGGVGKTTTVVGLGATLALLRGDR